MSVSVPPREAPPHQAPLHHAPGAAAFVAAPRFAPLFVTQFLGAFNDNLFKTALLFLIAFRAGSDPKTAATLVTAAAGVFIVPFFLFSGVAGLMSDARDKARVARGVKLAEVAILAVGGVALLTASVPALFAALFAMGTHSTVFGPVKYAILPQHLAPGELLAGTGLVEGGTFVAILLGQIAGGLLPVRATAVAMLVVALAGVVAAWRIPPAPPAANAAALDLNPWTSSVAVLRGAFSTPAAWRATLAISWFWAVGTVYTSQFVPLAAAWHASPAQATLFLALFTVGIASGARVVPRLLGGRVSARAALPAVLAMAAAGLVLALSIGGSLPDGIVADARGIGIAAALFALAAAGGVFSVPLYAVLQTASDPARRSSAIAANNIVNAAFQVSGTLIAGAAIAAGWPIPLVLAASAASGVVLIPLLRRL